MSEQADRSHTLEIDHVVILAGRDCRASRKDTDRRWAVANDVEKLAAVVASTASVNRLNSDWDSAA